jgi:hypothetical protein
MEFRARHAKGLALPSIWHGSMTLLSVTALVLTDYGGGR